MKTITVFAISRANETPGTKGYKISVSDPDPGTPLSRRTFISGFSQPIRMEIPDGWEIAEVCGEMALCNHGTPMHLAWNMTAGQIDSWPAFAHRNEALSHGALNNHNAWYQVPEHAEEIGLVGNAAKSARKKAARKKAKLLTK